MGSKNIINVNKFHFNQHQLKINSTILHHIMPENTNGKFVPFWDNYCQTISNKMYPVSYNNLAVQKISIKSIPLNYISNSELFCMQYTPCECIKKVGTEKNRKQ